MVWLTLDPDQSDPQNFTNHLTAALSLAGVEIAPAPHDMSDQGPSDAILTNLLRALAIFPEPLTIFLDDYHRAFSAPVLRLTDRLLLRSPEHCRVAIASRSIVSLQYGSALSNRDVIDVNSESIAFDWNETSAFLQALVTPAEMVQIQAKSEGWPTGLRLIRLLMETQLPRANHLSILSQSCVSALSGQNEEIARYLGDQVLSTIPLDIQAFLLSTSVLNRMNASLVDHLTGKRDGWKTLEWLRARLRREATGSLAALHRRAAECFQSQGLNKEALVHAAQVSDADFVHQLVEAAGGWHIYLDIGAVTWAELHEFASAIDLNQTSLRLARVYSIFTQLLQPDGGLPEADRQFLVGCMQGSAGFSQPSIARRNPVEYGLSPRESQVLQLLEAGMTSKEIASALGITANTVMSYRKTLYQKRRSKAIAVEKDCSSRGGRPP